MALSASSGSIARVTEALSTLDVLASVLIGVVGVFAAAKLSRHQFRQTGLELLQDLTTGEVATARNIIGTLMYGTDAQIRQLTTSDLVREYYVLLWGIERNAEGYRALISSRQRRSAREFRSSVNWHVEEIVRNLAVMHREMFYDDSEAWKRLSEAVEVLGVVPMSDEEAAQVGSARALSRKLRLLSDSVSELDEPVAAGEVPV